MKQRGRKSGAELAVVGSGAIDAHERPGPPAEMTDEQSREWLSVVNRLPADWFPRETHGLLAQYCRHVVSARRIAQLIEHLCDSDEFDSGEYDKLLKMQEREGRAMSSLATRMRMTQQATFDKERRKPSGGKSKPWER